MPSLTRAALFAILATFGFFAASDNGVRLPMWMRSSLVVVSVILAACAIVEGINWLTFNLTTRAEHLRRVQNMTPILELLRVMTNLTSQAQVELAVHFDQLGVDYRILVGEPEPVFSFTYGGQNIPFEFISAFFALSTDRHLPEVRQWTAGSHKHMWADALTAYLVKKNYATPGRGNKPAAWNWEESGRYSKRHRAEKAFGLLESNEYEESEA